MRTLALTLFLLLNTFIGHGQNLISNWSFESGGQLDCKNWYDYCGRELSFLCDTIMPDTICGTEFYRDAPLEGGTWSIKLNTSWFPVSDYAITYITGFSGTNVFELRVWEKQLKNSGAASIGFGKVSHGVRTWLKKLYDRDTATIWKQIKVIDTITTQNTDSIFIYLSGGGCEICAGSTLFDLIELFTIDTLYAKDVISPSYNIHVYPNPSSDNITMELIDSKKENRIWTLYTSTGQVIKTIKTTENIITIDVEDFASGIYFYHIQRSSDNRTIGQGKIMIY